MPARSHTERERVVLGREPVVLTHSPALLRPRAHGSRCPCRAQGWTRALTGTGSFCEPRHDINAPDLYLPTMAFVTYILLIAYHLGQQGRFTPEVFGLTASKGLGVVLLEVTLMKATFYLFPSSAHSPGAAVLDLLAYSGYKFVAVVVNMMVGLVVPTLLHRVVSLYTAMCTGARPRHAARPTSEMNAALRAGGLLNPAPAPTSVAARNLARRLFRAENADGDPWIGDADSRGDEAKLLHLRAGWAPAHLRVVPPLRRIGCYVHLGRRLPRHYPINQRRCIVRVPQAHRAVNPN